MNDSDFIKIIRPEGSLGLIEYRVIGLDGSKVVTRFWSHTLPYRFYTDRHYYLSPTLRPYRSSRVLGAWVLWMGVNSGVLPKFNEFPEASVIVSSGHGYHFYWALRNFAAPSQLRAWLPILTQKLGGDFIVAIETRLLRVPGSTNPNLGKVCEIVNINNNRYTHLDLGLPDVVR